MAPIPNKVRDRLIAGIKRYHPVLSAAKSRDVNESDTVTIITDMLADVFGFDKYSEITSEYSIRGTYVDLAIKLDGKLQALIEVKSIDSELKETYVKQAVDYAANEGVEWVILTSGVLWQVYKVSFGKPIDKELVLEIDFLAVNARSSGHIENLYLLTREGIARASLGEYHAQRQALSRFVIGAMILNDAVLKIIHRQLRRVSPDVKIEIEEIRDVLAQEVLKRDVVEGEQANEARRKVSRAANRMLRKTSKDERTDDVTENQEEHISEPVPATTAV